MRTLLVFAKQPRPGRVKTRLARHLGAAGACRLYRAFLEDLGPAVDGVTAARLVWWVDGDPARVPAVPGRAERFRQPPGDLGRRLTAAFSEAFAAGGRPVAVVGTDCPTLSAAAMDALLAAAEGGEAAVIPAGDGGYTGLALPRPCPAAFRGVPWSTPGVLAATRTTLAAAGLGCRVLPTAADVDTGEDLERLAQALAREPALAPATARALAETGIHPTSGEKETP